MKYLLDGIETNRLKFRLLESRDFDTWLKMFNEQAVACMLGVEDIPTPYEQCRNWFNKMAFRYQNDLGGMNALIDKNTNVMIGQSGILVQEVDGEKQFEVAYSILPEYWNRGYATEASKKCRDHAFENGFADELISIIHKDNLISEKVAVKNSMHFIKSILFKERYVNIYGISKSHWRVISSQHR
ncbi:MAG: GNAT family N-acetyltransferase [Bacteroidetes bacterium]|jgi:RimJ/RimL family protein N-acetyltransferase|nr:GNAT family N-acetyltransferase [Bacteroidota bacterium]